MKKLLFLVAFLVALLTVLLQSGWYLLRTNQAFLPQAGLQIDAPSGLHVLVDNQEVGLTPLKQQGFLAKDYLITLKDDQVLWQGYVQLQGGTWTIIRRDRQGNTTWGELVSLNPGSGAKIISNPSGAQVELDGKIVGQTPLSVPTLEKGEHIFILTLPNYSSRSIQAGSQDGFALNLQVDLAPSEAELAKIINTPIQTQLVTQLVVKPTPTGFLRMRDQPSLAGKEIGQLKVGEIVNLEEEIGTWYKIKTANGLEGYISSQYVEKTN